MTTSFTSNQAGAGRFQAIPKHYLLVAWLAICSAPCFAGTVSCPVIREPQPDAAEKALIDGNLDKAVDLYKAEIARNAASPAATAGLVEALLRQQKVDEAAEAVRSALAKQPQNGALISARGEVEYRQGLPWQAAQSAQEAARLDPCNARNLLLLAKIAALNSEYASADRFLATAHALDPDDPQVRQQWLNALPLKQRITFLEGQLANPKPQVDPTLAQLRTTLDGLKDEEAMRAQTPCRLASAMSSTRVPFVLIMRDATHFNAFGLDVKLGRRSAHLEIDTGADGLLVTRSVAEHAGLKPLRSSGVSGVGDRGIRKGYIAYAPSIRIGGLEFQNCAVHVVEDRGALNNDGLIGMDVFSQFLVTLNFPEHALLLDPLPKRPESEAAAPSLQTSDIGHGSTPAAADGARENSVGRFNRYIAPEMSDYTRIYRVGHDLIIPASLNDKITKLFLIDTGSWTTTISPKAAAEITKVYGGLPFLDVRGVSGKVSKLYSTDQITFHFANIVQKGQQVVAFDTSGVSRSVGMEISGFLGATTLDQLVLHLDYRDGLVKFEYKRN